jgi:tetratricopeptide (TPR) repeat protein
MDKPGLATALRGVIRINAPILFAGAAILAWGAWRHHPVTAVIGAAALLFPFTVFFWKRRHLDRYRALQMAYARGQWDEVRRLATMLRTVTNNALLPWDLDVRLACIEARQGRLQAAVAGLEPWRPELAGKAPGMFEARLASVYFAGGDYAEHVRLMEQAAELGGQDPSRLVDVALAHAKFGDPRRAEDILYALDVKLLPPIAHMFISLINGVLRLRADQPDKAIPELRAASEGFLKTSLQSPSGWVGLASSSGYMAVALARCGKRDEAQLAVSTVLPILLVHGDKPLLDMLQKEVLEAAP